MISRIAWFITPHGFGHAARAAAVMAALHSLDNHLHFDIYTLTPEFFFRDSLPSGCFHLFSRATDIGLMQQSSLQVDLPETLRRLEAFLPFNRELIGELSHQLLHRECRLVVCDIAPVGIAAASGAGIPSLLMENFTWDWIYEEYAPEFPALLPHIAFLRETFAAAVYHIRTEPAHPRGRPSLIVPPISRSPRLEREMTRKRLGIKSTERLAMITLGGIPSPFDFYDDLRRFHREYRKKTGVEARFLVPGSNAFRLEEAIIRLPYDSGFYHPDLIAAADVIVGKPGYGTVGEVYHAGKPFGYITRPDFRESAVMESFMAEHMPGAPISAGQFRDGQWLSLLPSLLEMPVALRPGKNGAVVAAEFILNIINQTFPQH